MLSRVQALNYRCLRYIDRPLLPFQVLIGPNASGKSSFLDVVALLGDYVREGLDNALLQNFQNPIGRATNVDQLIFHQSAPGFELAIELRVPEKLASRYQYARYEVGFTKEENGELAIAGETLWLHNDAEKNLEKPEEQRLQFPTEPVAPNTLFKAPGRNRPPRGWRKVVNKILESGNDYFRGESSDWNMMFRLGSGKSSLGGLPQDKRFPISMWVRDILLQGIHILALNSIAMRRPCSPSEVRTFKVDGSNLPLVVQDLEKNNPEVFRDWVAHIRTVLTDVQKILVQERSEDKHLYLAIQYKSGGEPVPSWLLSDGTLRMLALTLLAYIPFHEGIYLIEEPENGIHPKAIEAVFLSLSSVYDSQILLATHSPLFLALAKTEQMLCFAKNPSGAIDIVSGDKHPSLQNWHGQISLATLYAAGVLG
ncbi:MULTISPECIES: methylation-associated defense system AAA family ATPase MAD3 [Aerosakkonema]|uniref:methylation-associated defense system AAA family ATPase MAD3 n=1 Tax=Aerosakkonema TaxID=1246629 RepID=UPI0035B93749